LTPRELARLATDRRLSEFARTFFRQIALPASTGPVQIAASEPRAPRHGGRTHEVDDE
jgi:hypothetical protein